MKTFYLLAAILGALIPLAFFSQFFAAGAGLEQFLPAVFANPAAGGFTADLFLSSFVFWAFMFSQRAGPKPWLFIVLNLAIGLSCALPAYLYARENRRAD